MRHNDISRGVRLESTSKATKATALVYLNSTVSLNPTMYAVLMDGITLPIATYIASNLLGESAAIELAPTNQGDRFGHRGRIVGRYKSLDILGCESPFDVDRLQLKESGYQRTKQFSAVVRCL